VGEKCSDKFRLRIRLPRNSRDLLRAEGKRAEGFFALKNPTVSAGFERANLATKGHQATSRPPKPIGKPLLDVNHAVGFLCHHQSRGEQTVDRGSCIDSIESYLPPHYYQQRFISQHSLDQPTSAKKSSHR
jgi:hypothetical protein